MTREGASAASAHRGDAISGAGVERAAAAADREDEVHPWPGHLGPVADGRRMSSLWHMISPSNTYREFGEVTYPAGEDLREATNFSDEPKCNELLGDVDAVSGEVLMFRTCADAGESGMYLGAIDGRSATQRLPGRVGAPSFSPDGRWVTFGYGPLGSNLTESARIWVMRTDRTGLAEITDTPSSFPVWTNNEL